MFTVSVKRGADLTTESNSGALLKDTQEKPGTGPPTSRVLDEPLCYLPLFLKQLFILFKPSLADSEQWQESTLWPKIDWSMIQSRTASLLTHQTVPAVSPFPVGVGQVTVFVPPGAAVGQGTVTQGDVIVWVNGGPRPALVVGHSITWGSLTIISNNS